MFLIRWAKAVYEPIVSWAIRLRWAVVVGAFALVAATFGLAARLGSEFVPKLERGGARRSQPTRMPSIALTTSTEMQERVEQELLREFPDEIAMIFARTGTSEIVTDVCGPEVSDTYMLLKPRQQWKRAQSQEQLAEAMAGVVRNLPGQNYEFSQPIELRMNELIAGVRSDLAVKVYGDDLDVLVRYATRIAEELNAVPGATDLKVEQVAGMPMITIDIDRSAVARYGLNVRDVQEVVEIAMGGVSAGQVIEGDRRFELVVRMPERLRGDIRTLGALPIPLPERAAESYASASSHGGRSRARPAPQKPCPVTFRFPAWPRSRLPTVRGGSTERMASGAWSCNATSAAATWAASSRKPSSASGRRSGICRKAIGSGGAGSMKT